MRFGFAFVGLLTLPLVIAACTRTEAAPTPIAPVATGATETVLTSTSTSTAIAADAPTCGEAAAATCGSGDTAGNGEKACCGGGATKVAGEADEPSCGAHATHGAKKGDVQVAFDKAPAHGDKALCLVMNREFVVDDRTSTSIYEGKTYAFCCDGCKQVFDENPAKFVHADVKPKDAPATPSKS